MNGYDTNLAAEFYVLSVLHRLGMSATLTLGNKKSVDVVIARDAGDAVTLDVKGLAGTTNWPVDNLKEGRKKHFIVFVTVASRARRTLRLVTGRGTAGNEDVLPVFGSLLQRLVRYSIA